MSNIVNNKCFIVYKADNKEQSLNYVEVEDSELPKTIDNLCLEDNEFFVIRGEVIKDLQSSKMVIPVNLMK